MSDDPFFSRATGRLLTRAAQAAAKDMAPELARLAREAVSADWREARVVALKAEILVRAIPIAAYEGGATTRGPVLDVLALAVRIAQVAQARHEERADASITQVKALLAALQGMAATPDGRDWLGATGCEATQALRQRMRELDKAAV